MLWVFPEVRSEQTLIIPESRGSARGRRAAASTSLPVVSGVLSPETLVWRQHAALTLSFFAALNSSVSQHLGVKLRGESGPKSVAQPQGGRGCCDARVGVGVTTTVCDCECQSCGSAAAKRSVRQRARWKGARRPVRPSPRRTAVFLGVPRRRLCVSAQWGRRGCAGPRSWCCCGGRSLSGPSPRWDGFPALLLTGVGDFVQHPTCPLVSCGPDLSSTMCRLLV